MLAILMLDDSIPAAQAAPVANIHGTCQNSVHWGRRETFPCVLVIAARRIVLVAVCKAAFAPRVFLFPANRVKDCA